MEVQESVQQIVDKFSNTGDIKKVFGEPIEKNGKTIIPVAEVRYALGGGFGKHKAGSDANDEGEGGGGAVSAKPIGIVEISESGTRFIRFNQLPFLIVVVLLSWSVKGLIKKLLKR